MNNQPGNMKNQPGTNENYENQQGTMNYQPGTMNTHENRPGTINKQKRYKQTDRTFRHSRGDPTDLLDVQMAENGTLAVI